MLTVLECSRILISGIIDCYLILRIILNNFPTMCIPGLRRIKQKAKYTCIVNIDFGIDGYISVWLESWIHISEKYAGHLNAGMYFSIKIFKP